MLHKSRIGSFPKHTMRYHIVTNLSLLKMIKRNELKKDDN